MNRREPRTVAALAAVLLTAGLTLLWLASGLTAALLAAVVAGAGFSFIFPSLAGVALESVDEANRGKALAAFTNFYDVGVGTGALLAGTAARYTGYPSALLFATTAGIACLVVTLGASATRGARIARKDQRP